MTDLLTGAQQDTTGESASILSPEQEQMIDQSLEDLITEIEFYWDNKAYEEAALHEERRIRIKALTAKVLSKIPLVPHVAKN